MATGASNASAAPAMNREPGWGLLWALSLAQLTAWGTLYYSFSLFVVPMEAELGWSRTALNGALSLGLLTAGLCAYPVGAWIDRFGGRALMTGGTLLGSAVLALWSQIESLALFYGIWALMGVALAAGLYEPAFAVVTRLYAGDYRRRITALTLVGGFASTVFIPLTQLFIELLGWRHALLALSACNLLVGLVAHGWLLGDRPRSGNADRRNAAQISNDALRRAWRHPVFWGLAVCFTAYYATFTALTFHLVPLLSGRGLATSVVIGAFAVIGPAQVAGRIALLVLGRRLDTKRAGRAVVLAFPLSVAVLALFPHSVAAVFVFAVIYGAANGIMTIVRGTAVPELLGPEGYGAVNGALALPATLAKAGAPFVAALIWQAAQGYDVVLWTVFSGGCLAALGFWFATARAGGEPRS
jgi:predicted MFS family arabinose efflux permease